MRRETDRHLKEDEKRDGLSVSVRFSVVVVFVWVWVRM